MATNDEPMERPRQLIRASGDFVSESTVKSESLPRWAQLHRLQVQGGSFALQFDGEVQYLRYAFSDNLRQSLIPDFGPILHELRDKMTHRKRSGLRAG